MSVQAFVTALMTIANTDSGVQAITGGSTDNLLPWADIAVLPAEAMAFIIIDDSQTPQNGEQHDIQVRFSCFAKSLARAKTLAARVTSEGSAGMFTQPNFLAQSVDACPFLFTGGRDATALENDGRKEHRYDVEGDFEVKIS